MSAQECRSQVTEARYAADVVRKQLAASMVSAAHSELPAHTARQLGKLWERALQLWEDLGLMLACGALDAPAPPAEPKE